MKSTTLIATVLALGMAGAAPAQAPNASPPVYWAGCAGALAVKAQRGDKAAAGVVAPMARRALEQAKKAPNPQQLTAKQIDGVAFAAAKSFKDELAANPGRIGAFENAVQLCMKAVGKLPA